MHFTRTFLAATLGVLLPLFAQNANASINFDDIALGANSHYFPETSTTFTSGGAVFNHSYSAEYGSWGGWSVSNENDLTTVGWPDNQFSAYSLSSNGTNNYALAYASVGGWGTVPSISFQAPTVISGAEITNTTYAVLSMRDGDSFAKKFGGISGNDADWFKLTITGFNGTLQTGSVDVYLADYRFADNSLDYVIKDWTFANLSSLGAVTRLSFTMDSSDMSPWGINTPAYFALDNLTLAPVPEPEQWAMLTAGLAILGAFARKRRPR